MALRQRKTTITATLAAATTEDTPASATEATTITANTRVIPTIAITPTPQQQQ